MADGPEGFFETLRRALFWLYALLHEALFGRAHAPAWDDVGDGLVVHA